MSLNYQRDPATQVPNLFTGVDGVPSLVKYFSNGTDEIKNLLKNECGVIYECNFCRAMFRSIINFVAHKRTICRSLNANVESEYEQLRNKVLKTTNKEEEQSTSTVPTASASTPPLSGPRKRNPNALRRVNLASNLSKNIQIVPVKLEETNQTIELPTLPKVTRKTLETFYEDGKQVVETASKALNFSINEQIPKDRTVLVMPKDDSIRYGEMHLRKRRNVERNVPNEGASEINAAEIEILERIPAELLEFLDFENLKCLHKQCSNIFSFASLEILAHHLAIHHQKSVAKRGELFCFNCNSIYKSIRTLYNHFNLIHSDVRQKHKEQRVQLGLSIAAPASSKAIQGRKHRSASPQETALRLRSLSPMIDSDSLMDSTKLEIKAEPKRKRVRELKQPIKRNLRQTKYRKKLEEVEAENFNELKPETTDSTPPKNPEQEDDVEAKSPEESSNIIEKPKDSCVAEKDTIENELNEANEIDHLLNSIKSSKSTQIDKVTPTRGSENTSTNSTNSNGEISDTDCPALKSHLEDAITSCSGDEEESNLKIPELTVEQEDPKKTSRRRMPTSRIFNEEYVVAKNKDSHLMDFMDLKMIRDQMSKDKPTSPKKHRIVRTNIIKDELRTSPAKKVFKILSNSPKMSPVAKKLIQITKRKYVRKKKIPLEETSDNNINDCNLTTNNDTNLVNCANETADNRKEEEEAKNESEKAVTNNLQSEQAQITPDINSTVDSSETTLLKANSEPPLNTDSPVKTGAVDIPFRSSPQKTMPKILLKRGTSCDRVEVPISALDDSHQKSALSSTAPLQKAEICSKPSPTKEQLPSVVAGRHRENLAFYTPRARHSILNDESVQKEMVNEVNTNVGSSRRKQNMWSIQATESDETYSKEPPPRPEDLQDVPIYLTEMQRKIFFAPLRPMFSGDAIDGLFQCAECGEVLRNNRDGRKHMVYHLRVMRIRCTLCDVGAFFCSDMRVHLMFRHCEKLHLAPDGYVLPGNVVPCMDKKKADALSQLVDPYHPGRVMYTSGKIVSGANPAAYYPDPKIEQRILGKLQPHQQQSASSSNSYTSTKYGPKRALFQPQK